MFLIRIDPYWTVGKHASKSCWTLNNQTGPKAGPTMTKSGDSLSQLREAIDDIDDRIHDLLMARADLAGQIRAAKQHALSTEGGDMGSAYRPAREADMLRRLKARHKGDLPFESVARIWREIIASLTQLQSPYGLYICGGADLMAFHDIGRFYYGASAQIHVMDDAAAVVEAATSDPHGLGLLPFPDKGSEPWWLQLMNRLDQGIAVIAALPFFRNLQAESDNPSILVLSHAPFEPSGDDTSMLVLEYGPEFSNDQIKESFGEPGVRTSILDRRTDSSNVNLCLIKVDSYVAGPDEILGRLQDNMPNQISNLTLLGGYANPIREG